MDFGSHGNSSYDSSSHYAIVKRKKHVMLDTGKDRGKYQKRSVSTD